jgi:signal transduction histidine kinase
MQHNRHRHEAQIDRLISLQNPDRHALIILDRNEHPADHTYENEHTAYLYVAAPIGPSERGVRAGGGSYWLVAIASVRGIMRGLDACPLPACRIDYVPSASEHAFSLHDARWRHTREVMPRTHQYVRSVANRFIDPGSSRHRDTQFESFLVGAPLGGALVLHVPLSVLEEDAGLFDTTLLAVSGILSLLMFAGVFLTFRAFVWRPLEALKWGFSRLELGSGPPPQLSTDRTDELGDVFRGFNAMAASVVRRGGEHEHQTKLYRRLFEDNSAPMLIIDTNDLTIRDANKAAGVLCGVEAERLRGTDLAAVCGERGAEVRAAAPSGRSLRSVSLSIDGQSRSLDLHFGSIETEGREMALVILQAEGEAIDVETGHKRARLLMSDALRLKSEGLSQALEREKQITEQLKKFQSVLAHQLRNPLATIQSTAQNLLRRAPDEAILKKARKIAAAATDIDSLIERVLTAARAETGGIKPRTRTENPFALVRRVCGRLAEIDPAHRYEIDVPDDPGVLTNIDPQMIEHVVTNLVVNAAKYSDPGTEIDIHGAVENGVVRLRVSDRGIGIPADEIELIFQKFYRASNARAIPGNGLGMSFCREIVEAHKGRIAITSETGKGTTIEITLPVSEGCAVNEPIERQVSA